jgi:O-antigen ligase
MVYVLGLVALALAWLIPGHYFPWLTFQQETAAAIGGLLLALAALASPAVKRISLPPVAWVAALLTLVPIVQWAAGRIPYATDAALPVLYLLAFALTVAVTKALAEAEGERFLLAVALTLIAAALVSVGIALVQWLQLSIDLPIERLHHSSRAFGNLTQANHLATALGIALALSLWLFESRRMGPTSAWLLCVTLLLGLALTRSRSGIATVVMLLIWWLIGTRLVKLRTTWPNSLAGLAVFIALTLAVGPATAWLDAYPASSVAARLHVEGGRAVHWPAMWDAAWREPLLGWGWMQIGAAQQAVALDHPPSYEWITYSHNVVLDLLVWNGVVIGGMVVAGIAYWSWQRCWSCANVHSWSALAAGGAIMTHSLVEFPYAYLFFLLPLALFVGVVEAQASRAPETPVSRWELAWPRGVHAAAIACLAAVTLFVAREYVEVEEAARRVRLKEAGYVAKGDVPTVPSVVLLDSQREFIWFRLTEARPGMTREDVERMRVTSQRFMPTGALLRYALAAGLNGKPELAEQTLGLLCQLWRPWHCDEGRESWARLQERYPELRAIPYPTPGWVQ